MTTQYSILIVEDETVLAENYAKQFRRQGWYAEVAFSGDVAVEAVRRRRFSAALLDMHLPKQEGGLPTGETGFTVLKDLLAACPEICVVIFTCYGDVNAAVQALRLGAWNMIGKAGIRFDELHASIEKSVQQKQALWETEIRERAAIEINSRREGVMTLAQGIAHQIKNRLADFGAGLELLDRADSLSEARQQLPGLKSCLNLAYLSVNRLWGFARIQQIECKLVDASKVILEGWEMARSRHRNQKRNAVEFRNSVGESVFVSADAAFLTEAFECLLDNSIEAMGQDGGRIEVRATDNGDAIDFTVQDSGPGFSPEMLEKAHEPFYTSKGLTNIGFGLAFVKKVAETCGGRMEYGNCQEGAWVRLTFPRADPQSEGSPTTAQSV